MTGALRCLWITRQDPRPANSGELIYSLGLLQSLAATGRAAITVLAHRAATPAGAPATEAAGSDAIQWTLRGTIPAGRVRGLLAALPSDAWRLGNPIQREALRDLLARHRWDWVVIDQAACAWVLSELPATQRVAYLAQNDESSTRRSVARDRTGPWPMRVALRLDAWKYARMEHRLGERASLISAITPRDAAVFAARHPGRSLIVLPPGYQGTVPPASALSPMTAATPRRVVLAGAFEWLAKRRNLEAFLHAAAPVFPAAGIEFLVVGKADPDWLAGLAARWPWMRHAANVPSVEPYLADARVGLIPEALGGGFKLKALDYIFRGLPLGAIDSALSGVPIDPQHDAVVAPDLPGLVQAIAARIDDLEFLNGAAQRSLAACRDAFDWATRGATLADALTSAAARGQPHTHRS